MVKKLMIALLIISAVFLFTACSEDGNDFSEPKETVVVSSISPSSLEEKSVIHPEEEEIKLKFNSPVKEFEISSGLEEAKTKIVGQEVVLTEFDLKPDTEYNLKYYTKTEDNRETTGEIIINVAQEGNIENAKEGQWLANWEPDLNVDYPSKITAYEEVTISGQADSSIDKVEIIVDGHHLTDDEGNYQFKVQNGNYSLDYSFYSFGGNRELIVKGFNSWGKEVTRIQEEINVQEPEQKLSVTYPNDILVTEPITIKGGASDEIKKVEILVDGYNLTDKNGNKRFDTKYGSYSLDYSFYNAGMHREITVKGFDAQGNEVERITDEISIYQSEDDLSVLVSDQIKAGAELSIKGQARDPIYKVNISMDGYVLARNLKVKNNTYEITPVIHSAKKNRKLVVKAFDRNGRVISEKTKEVDVLSKLKEDALHGRTIVIDPGHGGRDSGAVGPTGYQEKDFNLSVSLKLKAMLERTHANVVLTRKGDYNVGLNNRIRRANNLNADFFLSVHANAASFSAHGTEQYIPYHAGTTSRSIAQRMQNNITAALNTSDRGVKTANYAVLRNAQVAAVLTEIAFLSNSSEERKLRSAANQEKTAEALFQAIVGYFN